MAEELHANLQPIFTTSPLGGKIEGGHVFLYMRRTRK